MSQRRNSDPTSQGRGNSVRDVPFSCALLVLGRPSLPQTLHSEIKTPAPLLVSVLPPQSFWMCCQQGKRFRTVLVFVRLLRIWAVCVFTGTSCGPCCSQPRLEAPVVLAAHPVSHQPLKLPAGAFWAGILTWNCSRVCCPWEGSVQVSQAGMTWRRRSSPGWSWSSSWLFSLLICPAPGSSLSKCGYKIPQTQLCLFLSHGSDAQAEVYLKSSEMPQIQIWLSSCEPQWQNFQFFPLTLVLHFGGGGLEMGLLGCSQGTHCTSTNLISPGRENHCHEQFLLWVYVLETQRQLSGSVKETLSAAELIVCSHFPTRILCQDVTQHILGSVALLIVWGLFTTSSLFKVLPQQRCQACAIRE